jgi:hypothetical protein
MDEYCGLKKIRKSISSVARAHRRPAFNRRSPIVDLICEAIGKRVLLEFEYHGRVRVVAPYCCGISTRDVEVLRAIQVRGLSASNGLGFGKLWAVAQMINLRILDETFAPDDPNYNPQDRGMKEIYCCI